MHEGGDVDTDTNDAKPVLVELELGHEGRRATLETTFVLASLNGVLKCSDPLVYPSPANVGGNRGTALAIHMLVVAVDSLPGLELAIDVADALD